MDNMTDFVKNAGKSNHPAILDDFKFDLLSLIAFGIKCLAVMVGIILVGRYVL